MNSTFAASKAIARASQRVGAGARMRVQAIVAAKAMLRVCIAPHRSPAQGPPALH